MQIEDATRQQARELARLINLAGEGIPEYLGSGMVEAGQLPLDVGAMRAAGVYDESDKGRRRLQYREQHTIEQHQKAAYLGDNQ